MKVILIFHCRSHPEGWFNTI